MGFDLTWWFAMPLEMKPKRGTSENEGPPLCWMVVEITALFILTEEAESPLSKEREAR